MENWRQAANRKPLMLRGARQVGKSSSVRHLSRRFTHFIEINFDEQPQYARVFEQNKDVYDICEWLAAATSTPVGLELIKNQSPYQSGALFYWQREARNSQAEVDYVIQKQRNIIPIEVKAGTKGAMQSMYLFLQEKNALKGIRFSLENFSQVAQIDIYPLYAVRNGA